MSKRKVCIENPKVLETYIIRDLTFTILSEFYKKCETYTIHFYKIQFKDTLTIKEYSRESLRVGKIEDYNRPTICQKGIVGERMQNLFYPIHQTDFYKLWHRMIIRCYSNGISNRGSLCCEDWLYLENFYNWFVKQEYKEGYELDKDLLCLLNKSDKIYSPETCLLIPTELNNFFAGFSDVSGIYKMKDTWRVDTNFNGERYYKSGFKTFEEAKQIRNFIKRKWLLELARSINLSVDLLNIALEILK